VLLLANVRVRVARPLPTVVALTTGPGRPTPRTGATSPP